MDLARLEFVPFVLAAVAVGLACGVLSRRRRSRAWAALRCSGVVPGDGAWRWLLAMGATGAALIGPRWGVAPGNGTAPGHEVVLLVDVSRSMAAEDAVPNRLGAAVASANALVETLGRSPGDRVAVVAFAGRGVLRCPLTSNLGAAREALARLRPGAARPGGTDLDAALNAARDAFPEVKSGEEGGTAGRSVVVFSDGEDLEGHGKQAVEGLRAAGIVVHAVTIGDAGHPGATVPVRDESGSMIAFTYQGKVVHTRREDTTLREIAHATGGVFIPLGLSRPEDVAALYQTSIGPSERARLERLARGEPVDRSALFTMFALVAGLAAVLPVWRRPRGLSLVVLALLAVGADRPPRAGSDPGMSAFRSGQLDEALAAYERGIAASPEAAEPRFNSAVILQRKGRYADADARYAEAIARARNNPMLAARIEFARGNNAYYQGDPEAALAYYDACLNRSGDAPDLVAVQRDAKINRAFVANQRNRNGESEPKPEEPPAPETTPAASENHEDEGPDQTAGEKTAAPPGMPGGEPSKASSENSERFETPEEQLEQAVERIRQRFRVGEEPPPTVIDPNRRDW